MGTEVDATGYDVVCDADPCDYATIRVESGTTDSCDSDAYITYAYVISECYEAVAGFSYASASCDDTGIVLDLYAADNDDCSGNATSSTTIFSEDTACTTISCSGGGGGGGNGSSAASTTPILAAFAMMAAIAAIAM